MIAEWAKVKEEFKEWYFKHSDVMELAKNLYESLLTSLLMDRDDISNPKIEGRIKDRNGCIEKFERKYLEKYTETVTLDDLKKEITDLIGIRVICSYEDEIEKVAEIIKKEFDVIGITDKTSILNAEKKFGYKGIHLDVKLSSERLKLGEYKKISNFQVEIQIRTIIQHAWSSLDHRIIYKHDTSPELTRAVERLAALFEIADSEFIRIREETKRQEDLSEERIKEIESAPEEKNEVAEKRLDSMTFSKFLKMKYPTYLFYDYKTFQILNEIFFSDKDFDLKTLTMAYEKCSKNVEQYKQDNERILSMNPYTMLRHILYNYDKEKYAMLLTDLQKSNFDKFLEQQ